MPAGQHRFPFDITLENGLPPTFRIPSAGGMTYQVTATILRSGVFTANLSSTVNLDVDSPIDFQLFKQRLRIPEYDNRHGAEDMPTVSLVLDRNLVAGAPLRVHITVDNQTRKPINKLIIEGTQQIIVHSQGNFNGLITTIRRPSSRKTTKRAVLLEIPNISVLPFQQKRFSVDVAWPHSSDWVADYNMPILDISHAIQIRCPDSRSSALCSLPVVLLPDTDIVGRLVAITPDPMHVPLPLFVRPAWQPDSESYNCARCSSSFGTFRRRHHCRGCGSTVCASCSNERFCLPPPYRMKDPRRVCTLCIQDFRANKIPDEVLRLQTQQPATGHHQQMPSPLVQMALPPSHGQDLQAQVGFSEPAQRFASLT